MISKTKRIFAGLSSAALTLSMLTAVSPAAFADVDLTEGKSFEDSTIPAHIFQADAADYAVRYYEDTPNVPYISLDTFYDVIETREGASGLGIAYHGDGTYTITSDLGASADFNVVDDTIYVSDFAQFFYAAGADFSGFFVQGDGDTYYSDPVPYTIDLSKYGINMYGTEDDIWLPASMLCNLYHNTDNTPFYINKELYFTDPLSEDYTSEDVRTADKYSAIFDGDRPADLAEYTYGELCCVLDIFYGHPGRNPFEEQLTSGGLDAMLDVNDSTKMIKEHLKSADPKDYFLGLRELDKYFFDGGHTYLGDYAALMGLVSEDITNDTTSRMEGVVYEGAPDNDSVGLTQLFIPLMVTKARAEKTGFATDTPYGYYKEGDTALFFFDGFACDFTGWLDFYGGKGERPDDLLTAFYDAVQDAEADPEIRNFMVDLSANGGGMVAVVCYMMSLISNDAHYKTYDTIHQVFYDNNFKVDKNLDGVFDEKDDEVKFTLNFGIQTTSYSFSCGNLMPSLAKDNKIMVIGHRSGGGSCTVEEVQTADGFPLRISSNTRLHNAQFENIDPGIEPDYETMPDTELLPGIVIDDTTEAYNIGLMSDCFADYYGFKKSLEGLKIETSADAYTYIGTRRRPAVTVMEGTRKLEKNKHYTVDYKDNLNAGTATITVKGMGVYEGTITKTFKINPADLSKNTTVKVNNKTYSGKAFKPQPTVKYKGKTLVKGKDYTVSYKNNTKVGKATVVIKGIGNYTGTKTKAFIIKPQKATAKSLTSPKAKTIKYTWKKDAQAKGYKVQIATNKKFTSGVKSYWVKKNSTTSKTIKGLKSGKTYYARVAAYTKVNGKTFKGSWSAVKKIKVK